MAKLRYLDLFAGAGGLSEGFIRAGFTPVSHVEMDAAACYTLKTRLAYKWLLNEGKSDIYDSYLRGECYGFELYKNGELSDSCWGFMGNFSDVLKDMAEYLPDECKGMVDHLEEQERPATIIKTLLKHAKIQVDQAAKAFEHASRQQVLGESR